MSRPHLVLVVLSLGGCVAGAKGDSGSPEGVSGPPTDTGSAPTPAPVDADGDGHPADTDCDDTHGGVHPGAAETCNGRDDDCDGEVDEDAVDAIEVWPDTDADGHGAPGAAARVCRVPEGTARAAGDCDDTDPTVHPGAAEWCDATDHDCDGAAAPPGRLADFHPETGPPTVLPDTGTPSAPQAVTVDTPGTLAVCPGTFSARLTLTATTVTVTGTGAGTTTLDGAGGTVVSLVTPGQAATLSGLTLTGGAASGFHGGGLSTVEAFAVSLRLDDVTIEGNTGTRVGAGLLLSGTLRGSGVTLRDNHLQFDHATEPDLESYFNCEGAGAYVLGDVVLEDSLVEGNSVECIATDGVGAPRVWGGGVSVNGSLTLTDSTVSANTAHASVVGGSNATASAAGLWVYGDATVTGSDITDNVASATGDCRTDAPCTLRSGAGGAAIGGEGLLVDSRVVDNRVEAPEGGDHAIGGGLEAGAAGLTCRCTAPESQDCGIYGNTASLGGGLWLVAGDGDRGWLVSEGCDWTGTHDNTPDDVAGLVDFSTGDDAWFSCDVTGCR